MTREQTYWLCQIGGWSIQCAVNTGILFTYVPFQRGLAAAYVSASLLALCGTHLLRRHIHRAGWMRLSISRAGARLLASALLLSLLLAVFAVSSNWILFPQEQASDRAKLFAGALFGWATQFSIWCALYAGIHYFERHRQSQIELLRLEVLAKDAQLRALLEQVNPHFLFNCLNSLRALIVEDPLKAQNMVTELAELLRYALRSGKTQTVPLHVELEAVSNYLRLEKIRFEDRLRFQSDVDPDAIARPIPPMLLQTLIENSVKHGIAKLPAGGEIRMSVRATPSLTSIEVINPGQLLPPDSALHVGLDNARQRLNLLYGSASSLYLRNLDGRHVIAELQIPARRP